MLLRFAICFTVIVAIVFANRSRHHPFPRFGPANVVTTIRAALVSVVVGFIGSASTIAAAWTIVLVSLVAAMLDGVDGYLARRTKMASALGARFDMEVDALLILALSVLVWQYERAGAWVVLSGLLRYLFVAAGWIAPWMTRPLAPSVRRQAICVVQIGGLILAMTPIVPDRLATAFAAVALAALIYSFAVDTVWLWRSQRSNGGEQVA